RQRVRTPCYGASKDLSREPLLFTYQGPRCATVLVLCPQSCRRRLNMANGQSGSPRNLGDPAVSSATSRPELPGYQLQAAAAQSSAGERSERVDARGTAKRRQRSAAGRAAGSHSALIVPTKLANGPRPEPGEESEASDHGTLLRNTTNASKFDHRVHQTGADSRAGETVAADGVHLAGLPDGHRLVEGSVPAHPQGRRRGRGRGERGRIRA